MRAVVSALDAVGPPEGERDKEGRGEAGLTGGVEGGHWARWMRGGGLAVEAEARERRWGCVRGGDQPTGAGHFLPMMGMLGGAWVGMGSEWLVSGGAVMRMRWVGLGAGVRFRGDERW